MVRVGGGWEPLDEFLRKHDPCRGRCTWSFRIATTVCGTVLLEVRGLDMGHLLGICNSKANSSNQALE